MQKFVLFALPICLAVGTPAFASSYSGTPFHGSPAPVPGTIQAEDFDTGGEGVAYHDNGPNNVGGAYRSGGVDIEASPSGGYDVGWTSPGEWLNYTVDVASAGTYTVQLRVASPGGGAIRVGFNNASSVWQPLDIPNSGGWQSWTTVSFTATLGAGVQQLTLLCDRGGYNIDAITISASDPSQSSAPVVAAPSAPAAPSPAPVASNGGGGTLLPVVEWNIQITDSETHARQVMDMLVGIGPRPEVIVIEEAYLPNYGIYLDELQRQTGQTWYGASASHCAAGDWNGSSCNTTWYQGVAIFSTHAITGTSTQLFPYSDCWTSARAGLRAQIDVNGIPVQVFATHLQTGGCTNDAQARYNSMRDLKWWASQYSSPQLVAGDFNADPDQIDTPSGMSPNFVDSWWSVGVGPRFTGLLPNAGMKLDYWFSDTSGRAQPSTSIVNMGAGSLSDHYPLEATFVIQ